MKTYRLLLLLICLNPLQLIAKAPTEVKSVPKNCKVSMPAIVRSSMTELELGYLVSHNYDDNSKQSTYWDVTSDRNDNQTFYTPDSKYPYKKLEFRQRVRIAKISNGYALVFRIPAIKTAFPSLPSNVEWLGWIPMDRLVYFERSVSNASRLSYKALVNGGSIKLYDSPASSASGILNQRSDNSIFYWIKSEDSRALLATGENLDRVENILGWVDIKNILWWPSRIAIEPNYCPQDAIDLSKKGADCLIYDNAKHRIGSIPFTKSGYDADDYRSLSGSWRFPLLYDLQKSVSYAIPANSGFLEQQISPLSILQTHNSACGQINLAFVLDGSRMYEPFIVILAEKLRALSESVPELSPIMASVFFYHDVRSGDKSIESIPFTDISESFLYDFIDMGGEYGFNENLSEAPLLNAINQAVSSFELGPNNYLVVIGGRGDSSDGEVSPVTIAESLQEKNINVLALQLNNNPNTAQYRMFSYLLDDVIQRGISSSECFPCHSALTNRMDDGLFTVLSYSSDKKANHCFSSLAIHNNGLITEDLFTNQLNGMLDKISEHVFRSMPVVFREGFSPAASKSNQSYFCRSAAFSNSELTELLEIFAPIDRMFRNGNNSDRKFFFEQIQSAVIGHKLDVSCLKNMDYRSVFRILEKIDYEINSSEFSLNDILVVSKVSDKEFTSILSEISRKYNRILELRDRTSEFATTINGETYYWIPVEDLF